MKAPWDYPVGPVSRKVVESDMELEVREMTLNQRLVQKYYDRTRAELTNEIKRFERGYISKSRERVA